jgi:hypothetical protein
VLERWAEPSGDQERAELVAVRGDSMGLVIQPRTADVRGRRIIEQLFFDRVLVEPAMVHNRRMTVAGPAPGFEFPGEAFDVGAADAEQRQGAGAAPGGELAQVQGVRLPGQASVSGQEPARVSRSGSAKAGWIVARWMGWQWSSGTSRPGWNRGGWASSGPSG